MLEAVRTTRAWPAMAPRAARAMAHTPPPPPRRDSRLQPRPRHIPAPALAPRQPRHVSAAIVAAAAAAGGWMDDGIVARPPVDPSPQLHSPDLAPVPASERTFSAADMAALWIGLVVSVSSWCAMHACAAASTRKKNASPRLPARLTPRPASQVCLSCAGSWRAAWWSWACRGGRASPACSWQTRWCWCPWCWSATPESSTGSVLLGAAAAHRGGGGGDVLPPVGPHAARQGGDVGRGRRAGGQGPARAAPCLHALSGAAPPWPPGPLPRTGALRLWGPRRGAARRAARLRCSRLVWHQHLAGRACSAPDAADADGRHAGRRRRRGLVGHHRRAGLVLPGLLGHAGMQAGRWRLPSKRSREVARSNTPASLTLPLPLPLPHPHPAPPPQTFTQQVAILLRGMEGIRVLEAYSAPVLIALTAGLLAWAVRAAGGFGPMLAAPSQFGPGMPQAGRFWAVFWPSLSGQIGYWATLALNIPDFTRCVRIRVCVGGRGQRVGRAVAAARASTAWRAHRPPLPCPCIMQLRQEPASPVLWPGPGPPGEHGGLHVLRPRRDIGWVAHTRTQAHMPRVLLPPAGFSAWPPTHVPAPPPTSPRHCWRSHRGAVRTRHL